MSEQRLKSQLTIKLTAGQMKKLEPLFKQYGNDSRGLIISGIHSDGFLSNAFVTHPFCYEIIEIANKYYDANKEEIENA